MSFQFRNMLNVFRRLRAPTSDMMMENAHPIGREDLNLMPIGNGLHLPSAARISTSEGMMTASELRGGMAVLTRDHGFQTLRGVLQEGDGVALFFQRSVTIYADGHWYGQSEPEALSQNWQAIAG